MKLDHGDERNRRILTAQQEIFSKGEVFPDKLPNKCRRPPKWKMRRRVHPTDRTLQQKTSFSTPVTYSRLYCWHKEHVRRVRKWNARFNEDQRLRKMVVNQVMDLDCSYKLREHASRTWSNNGGCAFITSLLFTICTQIIYIAHWQVLGNERCAGWQRCLFFRFKNSKFLHFSCRCYTFLSQIWTRILI